MVIHAYSIDNSKIEHLMSSGIRHRTDDISRNLSGISSSGNDEVYHTMWITDLLPIQDMNIIASASIDSNMCLWEMQTLKGKSIHKDKGHQHPIYSLEWHEGSRLILSAGRDHDIFIWNPIVKRPLF